MIKIRVGISVFKHIDRWKEPDTLKSGSLSYACQPGSRLSTIDKCIWTVWPGHMSGTLCVRVSWILYFYQVMFISWLQYFFRVCKRVFCVDLAKKTFFEIFVDSRSVSDIDDWTVFAAPTLCLSTQRRQWWQTWTDTAAPSQPSLSLLSS